MRVEAVGFDGVFLVGRVDAVRLQQGGVEEHQAEDGPEAEAQAGVLGQFGAVALEGVGERAHGATRMVISRRSAVRSGAAWTSSNIGTAAKDST